MSPLAKSLSVLAPHDIRNPKIEVFRVMFEEWVVRKNFASCGQSSTDSRNPKIEVSVGFSSTVALSLNLVGRLDSHQFENSKRENSKTTRTMSTIRSLCTKSNKLWGGRFVGKVDPLMEKFNASIDFDKRLCLVDAKASIAYANAMTKNGSSHEEENEAIRNGMEQVHEEWKSGTFEIKHEVDEDIHTANERRLTEIIGAGRIVSFMRKK